MNQLQERFLRGTVLSGTIASILLMALFTVGMGFVTAGFAPHSAIAEDDSRPLAPPIGGPQEVRGDNRGGLWAPEVEVMITFLVFIGVIMGVYFYLRSMPTEDKPRRRR